MYTDYPEFEVHDHGECEWCSAEDVDLFIIPSYLRVCEDCLGNETTLCSRCGQLWMTDAVEWEYDEDENPICPDCVE